MTEIDATHDQRRSWVPSANDHSGFPIQNLPLGIFSPSGGTPRGGIAIGDHILDLAALAAAGLLSGEAASAAKAASAETLNAFLAQGAASRSTLRHSVSDLLSEGAPPHPELLHEAAACTLHLPATIGDYTDFYAGIHHALNVGRLLRSAEPLMQNYKYLPVAYHGRASSVRPSATQVQRPAGQRKRADDPHPTYGPSRSLDHELELGIWIGPGNTLGTPIPIANAAQHIAGFCLLCDWSARDIQGWEAKPLGPFLGKSFLTTVSPWIITPEALAPFRIAQPPRPDGDPAPLDHLRDTTDGALDLELEVTLQPAGGTPQRLSLGQAAALYWTPAQMVAHHTSNGCNLRPGDLFGTGTISGPTPQSAGSMLELSQAGRAPITLPSGETRRFLEDGDTIRLHARASRPGYASIGFGECAGTIVKARD